MHAIYVECIYSSICNLHTEEWQLFGHSEIITSGWVSIQGFHWSVLLKSSGSLSPITMAMSYSMIKLLHTRFYKWRRYYPLQTNIFLNWKQNWTFVKRALSGVSIDTFYIVNYLISIDGPWQGGFNQCISISVMVFLLKEILLTNKCVYYCEVYKRKYFLCENESFISLDLPSLESPDRLLNLMSF